MRKILAAIFGYIIEIGNLLLIAYVILQLATMASIGFITVFSVAQLFMIMCILKLASARIHWADSMAIEQWREKLGDEYNVISQLMLTINILISWWIFGVVYNYIAS